MLRVLNSIIKCVSPNRFTFTANLINNKQDVCSPPCVTHYLYHSPGAAVRDALNGQGICPGSSEQ